MNDMIYLVAGYAVFWLVSFVLIFSMVNRQRKLEKEMTTLKQLVQNEAEQE
ncbi:MAG: CcmD family protein [Anaerolineae bacterium]|nr:CcmD family protein [Anaerolineae bacterium]